MSDKGIIEAKVAEWLDEQEGFTLRRERLYGDIQTAPQGVIAWLETAFRLGMEASAKTADKPGNQPLDEWVMDRRNWAEAVRKFPENTCPASRHAHMIADALADEGKYPIIEDDPAHVAGSLYGAVAALWEARTLIAELEERLSAKLDEDKVEP